MRGVLLPAGGGVGRRKEAAEEEAERDGAVVGASECAGEEGVWGFLVLVEVVVEGLWSAGALWLRCGGRRVCGVVGLGLLLLGLYTSMKRFPSRTASTVAPATCGWVCMGGSVWFGGGARVCGQHEKDRRTNPLTWCHA